MPDPADKDSVWTVVGVGLCARTRLQAGGAEVPYCGCADQILSQTPRKEEWSEGDDIVYFNTKQEDV